MSLNESTPLKTFIEKTLPDVDNNSVVQKLEQLGVETIEDLKFLQESDLSGVLKPVQTRKFLYYVHLEDSKPSTSVSSVTECPVPQSPISQSHVPQSPVPQSPISQSPVPQFQSHSRLFCLEDVLKKMPELQDSLQNNNRLQADNRRQFVREVVDHIRKISFNCTKKQFEEIAKNIVFTYPNTFEDRIDKIRIGTGYDSLLKQFISRNENLNRGKSPHSNFVRGSETGQQKTEPKKRKVVHDSYGCISWAPSMSSDEESEQEKIREELKEHYGSEPDWNLVYKGMEATYALQRRHINSGESVKHLREEWPFLVDQHVLFTHCKELTGIDLLQAVKNSFEKKASRMLKFFRSRTPFVEPYLTAAEKEKEDNNLTAILPLVILCLQSSLGEKDDSLFVVVDEMSSNEEVENACSGKSWPRLAMLGASILAAKEYILVVDGEAIGRYNSFLCALSLLFGSFYVFNIQYPNEAVATLEFIQRCFIGINPDAGLKTSKKKRTSSVNAKVLRLINELADYEWTD